MMQNKYNSNKILIKDINNKLQNYQGYVQFSHRPIDKEKDIFNGKAIKIEDENGFIYEAYFYNNKESISIKQINDSWLVSTTILPTDLTQDDIKEYLTDIKDFNYIVKMAQIWEAENDLLCENMKVRKLKKVVFAGFKEIKNDTKK